MGDDRSAPDEEPFSLAGQAASALARRTGVDHHDLLIVLGSGWSPAIDVLPKGIDMPMAELPGFSTPSVPGHGGSFRSAALGSSRLLIALGRLHLYEGRTPAAVVHAVRTAAVAGCGTVVLTNAAGSLNPGWSPGAVVMLSDHINLTGTSPLTGRRPPDGYPGRFADLTQVYSPRLRALVRQLEPDLAEGVYLGVHGPEFETPAEIRAAATMGADLCGMSTVLEAISARHLGLEVLGLSLVTNLAAGLGDGRLTAEDVFATAQANAPRVADLLRRVVDRLVGAEA